MKVKSEDLAAKIDVAPWDLLRAHLEHGAIITVDQSLDLSDTAALVANDDVEMISRLISSGLISRPTAAQVATWDHDNSSRFLMLIVSPYILVQQTHLA